jgi:tRNA (guanine37-N1)-methyltransferase
MIRGGRMRITILTLFPEMFDAVLHASILGRAQRNGLLSVRVLDIRAFSDKKHKNTDDAPFGGGAGMLMTAQPVVDAMAAATAGGDPAAEPFAGRRIYLSPRGALLTQRKAQELAALPELALLCGHYEGVDQRAIDLCVDEELSVGDYVLTGGELPAMVLTDCVARLLPGVLGCADSAKRESFSAESCGLLEYPQYTRPRVFRGLAAPEALVNGNHAEIDAWNFEQSCRVTLANRPELLQDVELDRRRSSILERVRAEWMNEGQE